MRILLVTPLYPPDIAQPAPYCTELARRLSVEHTVAVLLYGRLPEHVPDVTHHCVDKRRSRLVRLIAFTRTLFRIASQADIVYAENGVSVELPLLLCSLLTRTKYILHLGDVSAHEQAQHTLLRRALERVIVARAHACVRTVPVTKPEILPFSPPPRDALHTYETWWQQHLTELHTTFPYDR